MVMGLRAGWHLCVRYTSRLCLAAEWQLATLVTGSLVFYPLVASGHSLHSVKNRLV